VRLRFAETGLDLEIEDRGRGMAAGEGRSGFGLIGMRERAALVGGTIAFETPPEGGTLVRLNVPLEPWHTNGELNARAG
jgi:signal transduction histidine kinase